MFKQGSSKYIGGAVMAVLATAFSSSAAHAQLTTFAQFSSFDPQPFFSFTNSGSASTFTVIPGTDNGGLSEVQFAYQTQNAYFPGTSPRIYETSTYAEVSLSAQVSGYATLNGTTISQGLQDIQMSFVAETPVSGKTDLLTLDFASGTLTGTTGSGVATVQMNVSNPSGTNAYTSDFLNFQNNAGHTFVSEQMSISMSALNNVGGGTGMTVNSDGYVNSFTASGTGTFSSNPVPPSGQTPSTGTPEPCTLALGLLGVVAVPRRRK